jgi:putative transposase
MRKISFVKGEYYHVYNRGVDKRSIFEDKEDVLRFLKSIRVFNTIEIEGGIYAASLKNDTRSLAPKISKLVQFIAYCLNQNHYHFILKPLVEEGVQKFMHRLSTGYTNFFNEKYKRSGSLFQGPYKASYIRTNEQLLHTSVYVNLNDCAHGNLNKEWLFELPFSSFKEYQGEIIDGLCNNSIIIDQYSCREEYCNHAKYVLEDIIKRKDREKILRKMLID